MVHNNQNNCPKCSGALKYYDNVKRIVRTKGGRVRWIKLRRLRCSRCGSMHRELPDCIFPYKQYDTEIIRGVLEGFITCETLGYEDYPSEVTMLRWKASRKLHALL